MATKLEGRANVLKAEVRQGGGNVEAKKEEIAKLEQKAENATASQMNTLAEANKVMEEAAVAERNENKTSGTKEEKTDRAENIQPVETAVPEAATEQAAVYTHVDVRL